MTEPRHNKQLLADVVGEGVRADLREAPLHQMLRSVRRRRHLRQVRAVGSALAVLAALGLLVWHHPHPRRGPVALPAKPYTLVRTHPLPAAEWVETKPLPASCIVASVRTEHIITTAQAGVRVRDLTDDELLALAPKPAALVRFSPHSAELVFVNQANGDDALPY